ncbi:hypothetical protein HPB47_000220, partial [Ixodes persulcatus]
MRAGVHAVFVTILRRSTVFPLPIPLGSGSTQGVKAALRVCLEGELSPHVPRSAVRYHSRPPISP